MPLRCVTRMTAPVGTVQSVRSRTRPPATRRDDQPSAPPDAASPAIVPFGGAGPLHAARVAEELGVTKVVVPPHAGVLSAAGLLMSDYVYYRVRTRKLQLADSAMGEVREILAALEAEEDDVAAGDGGDAKAAVKSALSL